MSERASSVALVERLSPRQATTARVPRGDADIADDTERVDADLVAGGRELGPPSTRRRPAVDVDPSTGVERQVGLGPDRAADVHLAGGTAVSGPTAEVLVEEGDDLDVVVDVRAGAGTTPATCAPTARRAAATASPLRSYCSITRNELLR